MTTKTYNVRDPDGLGDDGLNEKLAATVSVEIAKEHGTATITAPHWPKDWNIVVSRKEVDEQLHGLKFVLDKIRKMEQRAYYEGFTKLED